MPTLPIQYWARAIGLNLNFTRQDFQYGELRDRGGRVAARRLFGEDLPTLLEERNETLAAQ